MMQTKGFKDNNKLELYNKHASIQELATIRQNYKND